MASYKNLKRGLSFDTDFFLVPEVQTRKEHFHYGVVWRCVTMGIQKGSNFMWSFLITIPCLRKNSVKLAQCVRLVRPEIYICIEN